MIIYNPDNTILQDVSIGDESYHIDELMGQHDVTLYVSYTDAININVGCYIDYQGVRYTLRQKPIIEKSSTRDLKYTLVFYSPQILAEKRIVRNISSGSKVFPFTATPKEHIQLIVDNLNLVDSGWSVGDCIETVHTLVSYNHTKCLDALKTIAEIFKTEYEIENKTIHLRKVEYNKDNPLILSYGKGNGFKSGIKTEPSGGEVPIEELSVQSGSRNIDYSKYGYKELRMPIGKTLRYDGSYFEGEIGFDNSLARTYIVDEYGLSIKRADKVQTTFEEGSADLSNIYPMRVGTVTDIEVTDSGSYNIIDNTIPANLDYSKYRIDGEKMTIIFQSGMLSFQEFDVMQDENKITGYNHSLKRFMLVSKEDQGQTMPSGVFVPQIGDKYAVFGMMMPDEYIRDDSSKTGASWDMFREACKVMYEQEQDKITFTGTLDGIWAQSDWLNISGKIKVGGYVRFVDHQIVNTGDSDEPNVILIRQTAIKTHILDPYKPQITLANTSAASYSSDFRKIAENEVVAKNDNQQTVNLFKRSWKGAMELINKLYDPSGSFQQNLVSSLAVQAMVGLFGDKLLQFSFWDSSFTKETEPIITFDKAVKQLSCNKAYVRHDTLGFSEDTLSGKKKTDYRYWNIEPFSATVLDDPDMFYYLYLKVSKSATENSQGLSIGTGSWYVSSDKLDFDGDANYYYLWVSSINSEENGDRQITNMYGFAELTPDMLRINNISSVDGNSFFRFLANQFKIGDANSGLDWNVSRPNTLSLRGAMVQSPAGSIEPIPIYRGDYVGTSAYYVGESVFYNGSTYTCIVNASVGILPTNTAYWKVSAKGEKGEKGADGQTTYTWIRYADTSIGGGISNSPTGKKYIGFAYNKTTATESNTPSDYIWSLIQGDQGVAGEKGVDGTQFYTWIKYSDNADGTGLYDTPKSTTKYIGIAVNKTTQTESTNKTDYTWSLFKGADGKDGVDGANGIDGKNGRIFVFRGRYNINPNTNQTQIITYVGDAKIAQVVFYNDQYYYTKDNAGTFSNIVPTNTSKWEIYGASFESVATGLLFADKALISGFNFYNDRIESVKQTNSKPNIMFNGRNGSGIIGQFDLEDGRLIGYKDGIERVQLTTDVIGSRENLLGTTQLYNNSYDDYSFSMDINSPTFTVVDVTQSFVLSSGDTIIADMDMALYLNSGSKSPNESLRIYVIKDGITIATADTSVAPLNYTITQNGTYSIRFHAYMTASYNEIEFTRGTYSSRFYANKVTSARKSILASDGFASVWDETKYFMLSATQGYFLEAKGTMKLSTPDGQQSIILDSKGIKFEGIDGKNKGKGYLYVDSGNTLKLGT